MDKIRRIVKDNRDQIPFYLISLMIIISIFFLLLMIPEAGIQKFVQSTGLFAPAVWILITLFVYIIAPLSGSPMLFAGYYLFGEVTIFYTIIVGLMGSVTNYYIARRWGRVIVKKFVGEANIGKIDKLMEHKGLKILLLLRIFQPNIHEFISYGAGLTKIKFVPYMLITIIGFIPLTMIWFFVARYTRNPIEFLGVSVGLSFVLSGIFIVGYWIKNLKKFKK